MRNDAVWDRPPIKVGPKALACLEIAALRGDERWAAYYAACEKFGGKVILTKFEKLVEDAFMECGVSARTGWLTAKGKAALEASR